MSSLFTVETVLKGNLYQRIKDALVSAGWVYLSSKPSTDFDVFHSKGVDNNKELYIQLQDTGNTAGTNAIHIGFRFINSYVPGESGVAGTFDTSRAANSWILLHMFPGGTISTDTPITFSYTCNADRILFVVEPPLAAANSISGNFMYIGALKSDTLDLNNRGLVVSPAIYVSAFGLVGSILINSAPYSDTVAPYKIEPYRVTTLSDYNNDDKRIISEIYAGNTVDGFRGKLDGIYSIHIDGTGHHRTMYGDILTDGTNTYKVIYTIPVGAMNGLFADSRTLYAIQIS
jgi:hypothetical protein